jgi:hypothetical protein
MENKANLTVANLELSSPANRDKLKFWFDVSHNVRAANELFTNYAYQIVETNFAAENLEIKRGLHEKRLNWSSFCWYFYRHVWRLFNKGEHKELMQRLFSDLAEFCQLVPGNIGGRYALLLKDFLEDFKLPEQLEELLPAIMLEKRPELEISFTFWREAEAEAEEEALRQGMMGY